MKLSEIFREDYQLYNTLKALFMLILVCKYFGCLVELLSAIIIGYKTNVKNSTLTNPGLRHSSSFLLNGSKHSIAVYLCYIAS